MHDRFDTSLAEGFFYRFGNLPRFGFVRLGRREHYDKQGEQQGYEIGIRNKPSLVIFVRRMGSLSRHLF